MYIIKPEWLSRREAIRDMLMLSGLNIVDEVTVRLTESELRALYPISTPTCLWDAILDHMAGKECEVGIVEGNDAVHKLVTVCGRNINPAQCPYKTIRGRFGDELSRVVGWSDGRPVWYHPNVIHRPRDEEEAVRHLQIAKVLGLIR
jgi:nucleoside diphosphate kinase